jgi:hypothetical protein
MADDAGQHAVVLVQKASEMVAARVENSVTREVQKRFLVFLSVSILCGRSETALCSFLFSTSSSFSRFNSSASEPPDFLPPGRGLDRPV